MNNRSPRPGNRPCPELLGDRQTLFTYGSRLSQMHIGTRRLLFSYGAGSRRALMLPNQASSLQSGAINYHGQSAYIFGRSSSQFSNLAPRKRPNEDK
jgi:hypothetical protein